jgi:hypothetical protein
MVYADHKAEFVFWNKECFQILGVPADAVRKSMQEVNLFVLFSFSSCFDIANRYYKF